MTTRKHRSSKDGKYVTKAQALSDPASTVSETARPEKCTPLRIESDEGERVICELVFYNGDTELVDLPRRVFGEGFGDLQYLELVIREEKG